MLKLEEIRADRYESFEGHERLVRARDDTTGLLAYIALHNTNLGPGLGGCRMYSYANEDQAVEDVLRLSRGMTYKAALAGLPLGGGKSVVLGDPRGAGKADIMRSMGEAIEKLEGRYITAEDVGTNEHDMARMHENTGFVTGLPLDLPLPDGQESCGGNPSPVTAQGVFSGIEAAVRRKLGRAGLEGVSVAVQGVGSVGRDLCAALCRAGARVIAADVDDTRLKAAREISSEISTVNYMDIYTVEADVYAPCALGATLNETTIPLLNVSVIAGAANNQLKAMHHDRMLDRRGILYAPDYVVNTGGLICVAYEYFQRARSNPFEYDLTREAVMRHVSRIGATLEGIFDIAGSDGITTARAADRMAEHIFGARGEVKARA